MILIVDDDKTIRLSLSILLQRQGHEVTAVESPADAISAVRTVPGLQLAVIDMNFGRDTGGRDGLELLQRLKVLRPEMPVILITAWGSIPLAVEGMRLGAFDFITKPWDNRVLSQRIETALALAAPAPADTAGGTFDRSAIIGRSPELTHLLETAARVAPTTAPVLILGENGTGKELVAQAIHNNSPRRDHEMVMVNLGGISQSLFESEMFGHVKGAYTGATSDRPGRFELADKSTIFLDEIGDLDLTCQVKLLRVLQQHRFERLGESKPRATDFRLVAATNADLDAMVAQRTFREDLLYRINLITLRLPPLRERRADIPLLAEHFAATFARTAGLPVPEISAEAMELLCRLPWPGNIRQLKNHIERTILVSGSRRLDAESFRTADPLSTSPQSDESLSSTTSPSPSQASTLEDMEREAIETALAATRGNISKVAARLGITRQTLYRKLEKYSLRP